MNPHRTLPALLLALALVPAAARGDTLVVKPGGTFPTVSSAVAAAASGDRIRIEAGVYAEVVNVPPALAGLRIETDGKVVIDARGPGGAGLGPGLTIAAADVRVEELTVRHAANRIAPPKPGAGVVISGPGAVLKEVVVERPQAEGFLITASDVRLVRCEVRGGTVGISSFGADVIVRRARVERAEEDGVVLRGPRSEAAKSDVIGCGISAVRITGAESIVRANRLEGNGRGVDAEADFVRIVGNTIRWTLSDALSVTGDAAEVRGNAVEGTAFAGVRIEGDGVAVRDNAVRLVGRDGILVLGEDAVVDGNALRDVLDVADGIRVFGAAATITENDVRRTTAVNAVTNSDGDGSLLAGNEVRFGGGTGVQVLGDGASMLENTVRRTQSAALTVLGKNVTAERNVARKSRDGMRVQGSGHTLRQNVVRRCRVDGIHVELVTNGQPPHVVTGNTVVRCGGEGIEVNADGTAVTDNLCKENRIDLATDAAGVSFAGNTFETGGPGVEPEIE